MANRRAHKKLREAVRARMAATGESYQTALQRIRVRPREPAAEVDLVPLTYFGVPLTLATSAAGPVQTVTMLLHASPSGDPLALPRVTWLRPVGVN